MEGNIDFDKILSQFSSSKFKKLRDSQRSVLEKYSQEYFDTQDLAIELPTGEGKTLIALLIIKHWMDQGKTAAVLCGNKSLATLFASEANELGMTNVIFEGPGSGFSPVDLKKYQRGNAIGIMNYWVYFNIRPTVQPAEVLVMDDAHLAENSLASMFSCIIDRYEHAELYITLLKETRSHYSQYKVVNEVLDETDDIYLPPELMPYIDLIDISSRIREICESSPYTQSEGDLFFDWKNVKDKLNNCCFFITRERLELRPYCFPIIALEHYNQAQQVIFMSATIGTEEDIQRRIGCRKIIKIDVPEVFKETTLGRRLILINQETEEERGELSDKVSETIWKLTRLKKKSLWLCSSKNEAKKWQEFMRELLASNGIVDELTWFLTSPGSEILEEFANSRYGHLFVGGRYDGMDFPDEECRLVFIPTMPMAVNPMEEFFKANIKDVPFIRERINQRLCQGLGRCNRNENDYSVYLLISPKFNTYFVKDENLAGFSKSLVAEIDLGQLITDKDINQGYYLAENFLKEDFTKFDELLEKAKKSGPKKQELISPVEIADEEVKGWTCLFAYNDYEGARKNFEKCYEKLMDLEFREYKGFWGYCASHAHFMRHKEGTPNALEKCITLMDEAIKSGAISIWFNRLRTSLNRLRSKETGESPRPRLDSLNEVIFENWDELLERYGRSGKRFQEYWDKLKKGITSKNHDKARLVMKEIGKLLGFSVFVSKLRGAEDNKWILRSVVPPQVFTFELKIEHKEEKVISLKDIGQAHNQNMRAKNQHKNYEVMSFIVTHLEEIDPPAKGSLGDIRLIPLNLIENLMDRVLKIISAYRDEWSLDDVETKIKARQKVQNLLPEAKWLKEAHVRTETIWVDEETFFKMWP